MICLTQSDTAVIELIRNLPEITQKELALQLHWKIDRVKYYTKKLSEIGILTRKRTHRKGYWIVNMDEIG